MAISIDFQAHRPKQYVGRGDSHLPRIIRELRRFLSDAQKELSHDTLRLPPQELADLAHVLVEFAEDLHNNIGIWQAFEQYNRELFGVPLPLTLPVEYPPNQSPELVDRLHHLLWILHTQIEPDLILGPHHMDLRYQAIAAAHFLTDRFTKVPRQSGVKRFLGQSNKFGWDVKRKLVWLGQRSYLFRHQFQNYVVAQGDSANDKQIDIGAIDNFICQETTHWSGLGVIDILAGLLPLSQTQRNDLRNWYGRHLAYYQIKAVKGSVMKVINLINNKPYKVRIDKRTNVFKSGYVVFGSLAPWEGMWCWSGEQKIYKSVSAEVTRTLPEQMLRSVPRIVYRYHKKAAARAGKTLTILHQNFTAYHGDNLAVYPDGLSMAEGMQNMYRMHNQSLPAADRAEIKQKYNLTSDTPNTPYPPELIESKDGVAVYLHPIEGPEMFNHFNVLINGLKKQGGGLSEDEAFAIQGLIESDNLSPDFIHRLAQEYGDASIAATYLIRQPPDYTLEYLLRRYKGHYYRNRYPNVKLEE